jgi:hypothetical protein
VARGAAGLEGRVMRVFIGLTEVAGYFSNLARGLGELGIETMLVDLDDHPFQYSGGGRRERMVDFYRFLSRRRASAVGRPSASWWAWLQVACRFLILLKAAVTCDAFIFSSHTTFLRYHELPLLRLLGKRLVFVFSGSDHRPAYIDGLALTSLDDRTIARCHALTRRTKARLRKIERQADVIVGHHLSAHLHERSIVPFLLLGFPFETATGSHPTIDRSDPGAVRIVHAPSSPGQKGTVEIRAAIDALVAEGLRIDFVELVNTPNHAVLDALAACDFVVDELYSDTRMAGLATEAAFFGKPAVVGGYVEDEDLAIDGVYPPTSFPPVHHCRPDRIEEAIRRLVVDVPYRLELGRRARAFVTSHWSPVAVAKRYVSLIDNEIPERWMFDPHGIRYLSGTGITEAASRAGVRRLVEMFGPEALCLSDKPELERAFLEFAHGESPRHTEGLSVPSATIVR